MKLNDNIYMPASGAIALSHALDCHVYLLDGGDEMALLDAGGGGDPERIVDNIRRDGLDPRRITTLFLTHVHAHHACGAGALRELTGARIACSAIEAPLLASGSDRDLGLDRARRSGLYPDDYEYTHSMPDMTFDDGQVFRVGRYTVRAIVVPGHSVGSVCYLVEGNGPRMLFAGDTVFHGGTIGLGNWEGSSLAAYRQSIGKLAGLDVDALFPGHFLWTLADGQQHLDAAIENVAGAYVPPAWQHLHTLR